MSNVINDRVRARYSTLRVVFIVKRFDHSAVSMEKRNFLQVSRVLASIVVLIH